MPAKDATAKKQVPEEYPPLEEKSIVEDYKKLSDKCDATLKKIKQRKSKK